MSDKQRLHCECLDWTQVGYSASEYWPEGHPKEHHPVCEHYERPPSVLPEIINEKSSHDCKTCLGSGWVEYDYHRNSRCLDCAVPNWYYNLSINEREDALITACANARMSLDKVFNIIVQDRMRLMSEVIKLLESAPVILKIEKE